MAGGGGALRTTELVKGRAETEPGALSPLLLAFSTFDPEGLNWLPFR